MEELLSALQNVPMEYRPVPFWSWNDALEIPELQRQIRWMHSQGIGGFFMHARGGLKTPYLSKKWMQAIATCCEEAKKLGMYAWAYDENGWPSGFAGGKLLENPENHDQFLTWSVGEFDPTARVSYRITQTELIRQTAGSDGEYLNVYIGISPSTVDVLNPRVVREFLDETHEKYKAYFGATLPENIVGFFTDEPQYYVQRTPYSPMAERFFREQYGEDIFDHLGLLFMEKKGYEPFRYRYWLTMQTLMLQNFAGQIYAWCGENGLRLTGHYLEESALTDQLLACGGIMPFYAREHIPGIDWLGSVTDNELAPRQVGSVARQLGKKQAITESFACTGWNISPADLHRVAGFQYACGVNLLCHHLLPYAEHGQRKKDHPTHFTPINPWIDSHFAEFNEHFSKLGYLLAESDEPVNVAVLHPLRSTYLTYQRGIGALPPNELDPALRTACRTLSKYGIGYHFLDETLLEEQGFVCFDQIGCGVCAYTYLVLPKLLTMGAHTEKLLRQFVENGGKILLLDEKPTYLEGERYDYTYLESNCTLEEILSAQPMGMETPDTELYATYRILDGTAFVYVQNASGEQAYTQTFRFPGNIRSFVALDLHTLEKRAMPLTVTLEKNEDILLFPSEKEPPQTRQQETVSLRFADVPVEFTHNFLPVEEVSYSTNGADFSEPILCCDLFNQLLEQRYLGRLWLRYTFAVREKPERLYLLAEKGDFENCRVNGREIAFDRNLLESSDVAVADIAAHIQLGENIYETEMDWYQSEETFYALFGEGVTESLKNCIAYHSELEPVYLAGSFGVWTDGEIQPFEREYLLGEDFYIGKKPEKITQPVTDGLPFFRGDLTVTQILQLKNPDVCVALPGDYLTAKVWVNGQFAGELVFRAKLDISAFARVGENEIKVTFSIGNRNLLGPLHYAGSEAIITPWRFARNNLPGSDKNRLRYKLRKFYFDT